MLITLHQVFVKNIIYMGNRHIGVKSQGHVPGKSSGCPKDNNETVTSPTLLTYKILYIMGTKKYMLLTWNQMKCQIVSLKKVLGGVMNLFPL